MTGRDLPRQKVGRFIQARTINRFAQAVADRSRGQLLSGFGLALDRRVRGERGFFARLSGAASPYSWAEVYGQVVGSTFTWVTMPSGRTGTSNAYEQNSIAGLNGKVVKLKDTEFANVWVFGFSRHGSFTCNWTFTLQGCSASNLQGYPIEIQPSGGGTTITSCTTNSLGVCTLSVPVATYDVVVTPPGGAPYSGSTTTIAHTCSQSTTITLSPTTDYLCHVGCCVIEPKVIALTWTFPPGYTNRAYQDDSLTWTSGPNEWRGATTYTAASIGLSPFAPDWYYFLQCSSGTIYALGRADASTNGHIEVIGFTNGPQPGSTCSPFHIVNGHQNSGFGAVWAIDG